MERQVESRSTFGLEVNFDTERAKGELDYPEHDHDGGGTNNHLASIYRNQREQFSAVVPFIRRGLERGERCLYVADDNDERTVLNALRDGGVDVDAALDSGALSVFTKADSYVRSGAFDQGDMIEFWRESLAEATDRNDYEGVRAAAEMTWALDEGVNLDRLVEYESMLNTVYPGEDYMVLCQYNRKRFPDDTLSDVIRTHPLVAYNGTVCRNFHYRPPNESLDLDASPNVDRMMGGLLNRAHTQEQLHKREQNLAAITDVTRDLLQATPEEICELVTETVLHDLEANAAAVWLYDEDADELRIQTATGSDATNVSSITRRGQELAYKTFVEGESNIYNDFHEYLSAEFETRPLRAIFLPLDGHGVFMATSSRNRALDAADIDFIETVAANTIAMLDRATHQQKLERQNAKLESFAGMLAHELRNPLNIAQVYLQSAIDDDQDAVEEVERAHDRIEEMIDVLLVITRGTDSVIDWEAVSLSDIAADVWDDVSAGPSELVVDVSHTIRGDRVHLWHLLENLFRNAVEHSNRDVTVRIGDLPTGFYVEDDGPGIPEAEREAVFEAGHSADSNGTGLGLTFVEQLADVYDWDCTLTESATGGARFEFGRVEFASEE